MEDSFTAAVLLVKARGGTETKILMGNHMDREVHRRNWKYYASPLRLKNILEKIILNEKGGAE